MVHTLRLDNYSPTPRKLVLGTNSSYGTETIKIERGAGWDGLNLTATWHIPGREEPLRVALLDGDAMDVPPEVTKEAKDGVLVLAGLASGVQRASCNVEYLIIEQAGVYGGADAEPTPELAAQVLQAVQDARDAAKDADQRATNAEDAANSVREDADNGKFNGPVGPHGPVGPQGAQGIQGEKGDTEERGPQGEQGVQGVQGEKGDTGAQGPVGETGPVGPKGDTGPQGERGEQGPQGEVGPEGPAGKDGAQVDDSTIGNKPWSSKHIIDMLCPPLEESGNPVVCYPVAGYALGVKASWEPVQEGSGTPSPENIRPIKGRDSVTVERCGENVIEFLSTEDSSSDIKIAADAEKNITLNGTLAGKGNITIGTCRLHWVAGKTYTMYVKKVGGSVSLGSGDGITFAYALFTTDYNHFFRGGTNSTNLDVYIASDAALVETELVFMLQCWRKGTVFNNFKFQIEVVEGTTTPSTYAPYNGQTNTLTLPETVYGGEVDAVSGEGQETWKLVTLDGTERWMDNGSAPSRKEQQWALYGWLKPYSGTFGISSHFDNTKGSTSYPANFVRISETSIVLHVASDGPFAIVGDLKSYLAAQYAAGTPVQICYKLATPVPFTATGAQPIPALAGVNTVLTDADSATVTGRADPIKRITDLEDAVASQT